MTASGPLDWPMVGLALVERYLGADVATRTAADFGLGFAPSLQGHRPFRPRLDHGDKAVLKLQHWLTAKFADRVSMAAMASEAAMSERSLARRFLGATGLSPNRYLQELRLERARVLLAAGERNVGEIAYLSGFSDGAHFRRSFRTRFGTSPADFRDLLRSGRKDAAPEGSQNTLRPMLSVSNRAWSSGPGSERTSEPPTN